MAESLKALQLVHRTLVAAAVAIIALLVVRDDRPGFYAAAYEEFRILQRTIPEVRESRATDINKFYAESGLIRTVADVAQQVMATDRPASRPTRNTQSMTSALTSKRHAGLMRLLCIGLTSHPCASSLHARCRLVT
jgi:hypothetical protein